VTWLGFFCMHSCVEEFRRENRGLRDYVRSLDCSPFGESVAPSGANGLDLCRAVLQGEFSRLVSASWFDDGGSPLSRENGLSASAFQVKGVRNASAEPRGMLNWDACDVILDVSRLHSRREEEVVRRFGVGWTVLSAPWGLHGESLLLSRVIAGTFGFQLCRRVSGDRRTLRLTSGRERPSDLYHLGRVWTRPSGLGTARQSSICIEMYGA